MKRLVCLVIFLYLFVPNSGFANTGEKYKLNPTIDKKASTGVYIPKDIEDAFKELRLMRAPELLKEMKQGSEKDMGIYHFGLGRWLRNNWALWKGSRLSKFFNKNGVFHPDDMSGIILTTFWRDLNNKPLNLDEEFTCYKQYWAVREKPQNIPCEEGKYKFGLHDNQNPKLPRFIHVAKCKSEYIVYEIGKGWYNPDSLIKPVPFVKTKNSRS